MSRVGTVVGLGAGGLATLAVLPAGLPVGLLAAVGLLVLAVGRAQGREPRVTLGALLLVAAIVLAGLFRLPDALVLFATLATVVAWDATENAVALEDQLGESAATTRAELAHVGATVVAVGAIGTLALLTSVVARGRLPALAGIILVAGAVVLVLGLAPFGSATAE